MDPITALLGLLGTAAKDICAVVIAWAVGKFSKQPDWIAKLQDSAKG